MKFPTVSCEERTESNQQPRRGAIVFDLFIIIFFIRQPIFSYQNSFDLNKALCFFNSKNLKNIFSIIFFLLRDGFNQQRFSAD